MNKFTKQCVAAFASLAMAGTLCVAGAVVANSVAFASGETAGAAKPAPWSTAGSQLKGTITIHKKDDTTQKGIEGAEFTIQKVTNIKTGDKDTKGLNVDLTSVDGWTELAKKVKQLNASPLDEKKLTTVAVTGGTQKTGKTGDATFSNLDLGLYLVKETTPPTGYTSDVVPFFMTVPEITREKSATNNTYTYNVEVTPKNHNVKNAINKTADTKDMVGVGDVLPYTIDATPNKTKATNIKDNKATDLTADDLKQYAVFDDALKTAYSNATADAVSEVTFDCVATSADECKGSKKTFTLTKGTGATDAEHDYYVTAVDTPNDATRTRISVVFLQKGLEKIAKHLNAVTDVQKQPKVHATFKFKIAETVPTGNGENVLMNKYGFVPGGKDDENHTPIVPESHTDTEFRKFHIFKYDGVKGKDDANAKLKDAKFKVFAGATGNNTADAAALTVAQKCADDPSNANNCSTALKGFDDSQKKYNTTNTDGVTADYTAKVGQKFYIVETAAPDKYVRSTKVYEVTLESAAKGAAAQVVYIPNVPTKDGGFWFNLPKTGAAGVVIFALAGVCLVCFGIFVFMRNRKKDEEQQAA
ncbi:SpaH/EbpB family LPXTG-anchored major pilin [Gardnerella vaginalis]|uniref:SpaH/EbpB family LPXTG-anchored major pilin n=1 Tax=Gardnerella vaginalis TaxID=2702 RepID=UPI00035310CF|nr:SpaH/EbpB family LPXTG-anchored major pilin [Gardnerella vaginalis]EPI41846.1 LPXTG-motif protein cell wall anchor domain protein [Gardnerella vaginalis JCP8481A]EPI43041.1 LPXTG-motif protein cell wall anchor domain protein [Gardnerella vaginalis JCP8481B]